MKRLTKGQYEALAEVIRGRIENNKHLYGFGYSERDEEMMYYAIDDLVNFLAHQFMLSDPDFKRDVFLADCGVVVDQHEDVDEDRPDDMVCPYCCSENINMVGDPEYNDLWACDDCNHDFGRWIERQDFTATKTK